MTVLKLAAAALTLGIFSACSPPPAQVYHSTKTVYVPAKTTKKPTRVYHHHRYYNHKHSGYSRGVSGASGSAESFRATTTP